MESKQKNLTRNLQENCINIEGCSVCSYVKHEGNWQNKLLSDDNYGKLEEMSCVIDDNVYKKKNNMLHYTKEIKNKITVYDSYINDKEVFWNTYCRPDF